MIYNNNEEPFAAFCNRIAAKINVKIPNGNYTLPVEYRNSADKLLAVLKNKKQTFPEYPIGFIQREFENMDYVLERLESKLEDGEIPDSVLTFFAYGLYSTFDKDGKPIPGKTVGYNDLMDVLQNIIKVVSVYFMLQI